MVVNLSWSPLCGAILLNTAILFHGIEQERNMFSYLAIGRHDWPHTPIPVG
jgi:hypothetical protein